MLPFHPLYLSLGSSLLRFPFSFLPCCAFTRRLVRGKGTRASCDHGASDVWYMYLSRIQTRCIACQEYIIHPVTKCNVPSCTVQYDTCNLSISYFIDQVRYLYARIRSLL